MTGLALSAVVAMLALRLAALLPAHPAHVLEPPAVHMLPTSAVAKYGRHDEVWRVPMQRREIALTFDDGPYPFYTPLLLHVLERSNVRATFFVVGRSAQEFPELVQRIVSSGDELGNHTFNHFTLTALSDDRIAYQIATGGAFLQQFTGRPLTLFRPPHGRYNERVVAIAQALGYRTIFWSDSPDDVKPLSPDVVANRVIDAAEDGGIVLLHSGQYKTIEALPLIIARLRSEGYAFVTVTQLLDDGERETLVRRR
ncbi:MAG: polysaccharide deacetylase [Candidatus Eremiobacter antarcticus]|nr:polysaccharide deacetylase family protein [Candidatus Eremiobacteraeota bacterium]MBC5808329.1 polysaccharide deacetylase family protein [Candidatus Eremiobacteraeota bacterium]PZR63697.1 MAG: polysaccharide deacetylase [Candidatus Eremiobacter sp. RRmetagenome_bin22]